ncbi:MAG: branched-chain amino acid ABC transporter permease [Caldisericaceae bacterium]
MKNSKFFTNNRKFILFSIVFYAIVQILSIVGILNNYWIQIINISLIYVILAVSLNIINGFTGQFSIGHMGFAAVGAYTAGTFTTLIWHLGSANPLTKYLLFAVALLLAGVFAAVVGYLIGLPSLRLRGDYLAIVTLAFGEIIRVTINATDYVGGPRGLLGIPKLSNFTVIFFIALFSVLIMRNIIFSTIGRAFLSIREDEVASELVGVDTTRYKVLAFTIGSFFAGIAGALLAHLLQIAHPTQFGFLGSINVLIMVYVGGAGSITGSIIAAVGLTFLSEFLRIGIDSINNAHFLPFSVGPEWRMVIYAVLLVAVMLYRTSGIMGGREFKVLIPEEEEKNANSSQS